MSVKARALLIGMATFVPGLRHMTGRRTGGTVSARYCYSVWLRHLSMLRRSALPTSVTLTLRHSLVQFVPGMTLNASIMLAGLGFMLALGLATGLLPAINAWRLKIAFAMGRG